MPTRTAIATRTQWGKETTPGTGVAANLLFDTFAVIFDPQAENRKYRPQGLKQETINDLNREWSEASLAGIPSYTGEVYLWSQLLGAAGISTVGTAAKKWVFTEDGQTETSPITFTLEQGSGSRAGKFPYGCLTDYGVKWSRKEVTTDGKLIGQKFTDGVTLTSSPTRVAATPVSAGDFQIYIDTTSGGLGTTQYQNVFSVDFGVSGKFQPKWRANRADTSWSELYEVPATWALSIGAEADANGMNPLAWMRAGQTVWVRLEWQGALVPGEASTNYLYQIDTAYRVGKPNKFSNMDEIWGIGWNLEGVRDNTWGKTSVVTIQNALAAL